MRTQSTRLLLGVAALCLGCNDGRLTGARSTPPPAREFATLEVQPRPIVLWLKEDAFLNVVARDQRGAPLTSEAISRFTSSDPAIATADDDGVISAVAVGTTEITVTTVAGGMARTASVPVTVRRGTPLDSAAVTSSGGWGPSSVHVIAGGTVRWSVSDSISWAGAPQRTLWLFTSRWRSLDSLDLRGGNATRRFPSAGVYRYCSGGCWDPPDFGTIVVY